MAIFDSKVRASLGSLPSPFIELAGAKQKQKVGDARKVVAHCGCDDVIKNPEHGMTGWCGEIQLIFNDNHGHLTGWYMLRDYQKLKAITINKPDWRIMPVGFHGEPLPVYVDYTPPTDDERRRMEWERNDAEIQKSFQRSPYNSYRW